MNAVPEMSADPRRLKLVKRHDRKDILLSMCRVPSSSRVFAGSSDFKVYEADLLEDPPVAKGYEGHTSFVTGVALAGNHVVSGAYDGRLIWRRADSGEVVRKVEAAHERWIRFVAASPDGGTIASVADDMVCRLWNAETGELERELRGHKPVTPQSFTSMLYTCAFSPDGRLLATGDRVGHIVVWDAQRGETLTALEAPVLYTWDPRQRRRSIGGVRSLAFSPDGRLLAAGGVGKIGNVDGLGGKARIEVFDWQKGERVVEFESDGHKGLVEHLEFHHKGTWLAGAGGAKKGWIIFLDPKTKKSVKEEKAPMHVHAFALNESSDTIYAVGHGKMAVWGMKG